MVTSSKSKGGRGKSGNAATVAPTVPVVQQQLEQEERRNNIPFHRFVLAWEDLEITDDNVSFEEALQQYQEGNKNIFRKMNKIHTLEDFCDYLAYSNINSAQSRASQIRNADEKSARYFPLRNLPSKEGGAKSDETLFTFRNIMTELTSAPAPQQPPKGNAAAIAPRTAKRGRPAAATR